MKWLSYKAKQKYDVKKGRPMRKDKECDAISEHIHFNMVNEKKFFKLFLALCKNCEENIVLLNKIQEPITLYTMEFVAKFYYQYEDDETEEGKEKLEHYTVIKMNLIELKKNFDD